MRGSTRLLVMRSNAWRPDPLRNAVSATGGAGDASGRGQDGVGAGLGRHIARSLGLPDEVREWDLADGEIRQPKKAHAAPRECQQCHTVFYGRVCPTCAYAVPLAEIQQVETELEEAKGPDRAMKQGNRRNDLWRDLAIAKKSRNPEQAVYALAQRMGFKPGWATHIHQGMEDGGMKVERIDDHGPNHEGRAFPRYLNLH